MNPYYLNGERLLSQGRPAEAAQAFQQALSQSPDDGHTHAMLALAKLQCKDIDGAAESGREALRLAPGFAFIHYVNGFIALADHKLDDAEGYAREAISMQPDTTEFYRLLSMVFAERRKWDEALAVVDQGLAIDPEDTDCLNLRSQILIQLRRTKEAHSVVGAALASSPDDAHSHANAGWSALHNNQTKEALKHFKESLRLDPGNDWAKAGLAEALKARNPLYRLLLGFILWMVRLDPKVRLGVIVGGYILYRVGRSIADNNPDAAPFIWPLLACYIVFAWMTWIGVPLADLVLQLSPYGRHALSPRQRTVSGVLGLFILATLMLGGMYLWTGVEAWLDALIQCGLLAMITVGVLQMHRAPRYKPLLIGCGVLGLLAATNWFAYFTNNQSLYDQSGSGFFLGFIGMMWFVALGGAGTPRNAYA